MKKGFLTLLVLLISSGVAIAQHNVDEWQYESYPDLPFVLNHIVLDLNIDKDVPLIEGVGKYLITSRRPGLNEIVFNTSDLEIQEISIDGNGVEFRVSSDSLIIQLANDLAPGENAELTITWRSSSPYGILKDAYGNLWTSLNPKARHHWLPVPDHPEVEATLDASITLPAEHELVFNGIKQSDEIVSTEEKVVEWTVKNPIPVSGISLAAGDFTRVNARSGVREVSFYVSENVLLPEVRDDLLSIAVISLKEYERKLSFEFPYESLNIVVLPDNHWEEIQSGAGIIYLYQNLGSLSTQLRRGLAEQWFGNYHRYLNAPDNKYEFLKVMVTGTSGTEQLSNPDELQSVHRWNLWEQGIEFLENDHLKDVIRGSLPQLVQRFEGVTGWSDYADFWYERTGMYWEVLPEFKVREEEEPVEEAYVYNVEYVYDEMIGKLTLKFEARGQAIQSLVTVEVREYSFTDTTRSEISFTGASDAVDLNISPGIDYVTLTPVSDIDVTLEEEKPFMFWIKQLRSSEPQEQIQAAQRLQNYIDNPDLQLALRDVLREEENPDVRAAMMETLSLLTKNASGTEETFLENLNSDNLSVKLSGLRALSNYPENDRVLYAVQNALLRAERDTVFNAALNTYSQIASADELVTVAERFSQNEGGGRKAIQILLIAAPADTSRKSITIADRYALGSFPYSVRKEALTLLMEHEQNEDYWMQTLEMLFEDRDPRVRYFSLQAVKYLSEEDAQAMLKNRLSEELDPRVLAKIRELKN
ncbi:MAG: hypothetical protein HUJ22_05920 [Gracilimonas sp.]|uniref:M1 family metallopeptidase n=1 Tax=Gracilimonas sp. TaxID=1974203 RepID=UPI0019A5D2E8|nr:hypothetical protein [Gracilimonas sp.]MBD3616093.1 hypothetical protein [Gracilimonas sp.]